MTTARQFARNSCVKVAAALLASAMLLGGCSRDANLAEKVAAADAAALRAEQAAKRAEHSAAQAARSAPAAVIEAEAEPTSDADHPDQAKANEAPAPGPEATTEG